MKALKKQDVVVGRDGRPEPAAGLGARRPGRCASRPARSRCPTSASWTACSRQANIGSINLNAQESTWYGKVDYVAAYKKLWGVS